MTLTTYTVQKTKFFIKHFLSKCDQIRINPDLVLFTEEIHNGKLHFLSRDASAKENSNVGLKKTIYGSSI